MFFDQIRAKTEFPVENGKIAFVCASNIVTYYIKLFRTGADRHNGILMSHFLQVAETMILHASIFILFSQFIFSILTRFQFASNVQNLTFAYD